MPFDLKDYVSDEFFDTLDLFGLEQSITVTEQTFRLQYAGENGKLTKKKQTANPIFFTFSIN